MAEHEPLLTNPQAQEMTAHVRDYSRFIVMMKWGAIICFVGGLFVITFVL